MSSQDGRREVVELLLAEGAEVDKAASNGMTPLYASSQRGHREVVRLLLTGGADVNRAMIDGVTSLYTSSEQRGRAPRGGEAAAIQGSEGKPGQQQRRHPPPPSTWAARTATKRW